MDSTTASRQDCTTKKRNKENVQPAQEIKSFIKQGVSKALQPKGNANEKETLAKPGKLASAKQTDRKQMVVEEALKKATILKKYEKVSAPDKKQTHSQAFKTEQAVKYKKVVGEAPKPSAALQPSRPAPGMYKGKVVESKIGSIWKSSAPVKNEGPKSAKQKVGNFTKSTSTSAAGRGTQTSAPISDRLGKPVFNSRPPNGLSSARVPDRSVPTIVRPRNATVAQSKRCGTLIAKPKVPVTDNQSSKHSVTSTISKYRANTETAEEKRAKLEKWLASKGKTLKRPAMVSAPPTTKTKVSMKPGAQTKSRPAAKSEPELQVHKLASVAPAQSAGNQEDVKMTNRMSFIMNTTLDLLENSDLQVESQESGDDIVINLCDALEALQTPSKYNNDPLQVNDECSDGDNELERERKQEDIKNDKSVKSEGNTSNEEVQDETEDVEGCEDDEDCYVKENTLMEGASVVKYSVKTTPFLQSVKKTIEDEVCTSTSKHKSNIKDLKFLTPVRRSSRIHRQSSRLPTMLVDHDPCVSSLAELLKLDDDANAYIYRKNPALLADLPDQPRL